MKENGKLKMSPDQENPAGDPIREKFLHYPLGKLILQNTIPAVASMLIMALYHMVDAIMVGRSLGPEALASVNILYPIMAFFIGLAAMIGAGGNARVAVLFSSGKAEESAKVLGLVISLGMILGISGSIITYAGYPLILKFLGTSGSLGVLAGEYLLTLYPFFASMIMLFILEQTVRNDGRPNFATGVMIAMAVLNIILDYIFLFPLSMGIQGAALATGIAQTFGAVIFITYFAYKDVRHAGGLRVSMPGGGLKTISLIAFNGSSELLNSTASGLTAFLYNRALLSYLGSNGVAAYAMVQYLIMFGSVILFGISSGSQPIISYNFGAGRMDRVRDTLKRLLGATLAIGIIFFVVLRIYAPSMVSLFIPGHPETAAITLQATRTVSWTVLIMPVGIISSMFFTAMEKAGSSLLVALSRGLVFTVIGLAIFPSLWEAKGIWVTPVFSESAAVVITLYLIYRWSRE